MGACEVERVVEVVPPHPIKPEDAVRYLVAVPVQEGARAQAEWEMVADHREDLRRLDEFLKANQAARRRVSEFWRSREPRWRGTP